MLRNTEVKNRVSSEASLNNDLKKKDQKCTFCKHIPVFGKASLKSGAGLFHNKGLCTHSCFKKKKKKKVVKLLFDELDIQSFLSKYRKRNKKNQHFSLYFISQ